MGRGIHVVRTRVKACIHAIIHKLEKKKLARRTPQWSVFCASLAVTKGGGEG